MSQTTVQFFREIKKTKKIPINGCYIEPNPEYRRQAFKNFMKLTQEIAENPSRELENLTLEELNRMIDEEREEIYQKNLNKENT